MAKKVDPLKAKEKKQKIIAAVGAVLLLGLLVFQVPRVMKQLNKKPAPHVVATTSTTPSGTPSLAAPTLSGAEQSSTSTPAATDGSGELASGDAAVPVQQGQLASFSRFASKDPFAQQLSDDTTGSAPTPSGSSGSGSSGSGSTSPSVPSLPSSGGGTPASAPAPGSAVISVNGALMSVTAGTDFPQPSASDPSAQALFHLVSLTAHTARIAIAGGSYTSGAATITLHEGKAVTLMNTADGQRYRLILEPQGTAVPSAPSTPTTASTTTPTSAPAATSP